MRISTKLTLLATAIAALLSSGARAAVDPADVQQRLHKKLGKRWTCKKLVVKVTPYESQAETDRGHFRSILIKTDAATRKGLTIAPLMLKSYDVVLDLNALYKDNEIVTKSRRTTHIEAKMTEQDLNKLWLTKDMPIKQLHVDLGDGDVTCTGVYKLGWGNRLKLIGEFEVKKETELHFKAKGGWINGVPLPLGLLNQVLKLMNPLLTFQDLPFAPRIKQFIIKDTYVAIKG